MKEKVRECYKVGPLLVINGLITPISRVITPVAYLFSAIYGIITPVITSRGPLCRDMKEKLSFKSGVPA